MLDIPLRPLWLVITPLKPEESSHKSNSLLDFFKLDLHICIQKVFKKLKELVGLADRISLVRDEFENFLRGKLAVRFS